MATIEVSMKIEANEQELGTLASLLLERLIPVAVEMRTQPLAIELPEAEEAVAPKSPKRSAPAKRPALVKGQTETAGQVEEGDKADDGEGKRNYTSDRLPFEDFDKLVRSEMRRLSMDKRMPGFRLWDEQRDKRLPTLSGVVKRYGKSRLGELAEVLGMQPPLTAELVQSKGG